MRKVIGSSPISSTKPLVKTSGFSFVLPSFFFSSGKPLAVGQVIGPGPGSSTKPDRKVGLFFFPSGTGIDPSAVRTKSAIALRRIRTISPPVIPRSEATWESPGTRCSYQRSARRLPRPYGPRNDVVFFTKPFFWWCGPDTPGGVSLQRSRRERRPRRSCRRRRHLDG